MRHHNSNLAKMEVWIAAILVSLIQGVCPAIGQSDGVELVLDRSPLEGGTVTPGAGVHRFAADTEVTITAVPQPGYRFAYWLGDVLAPTSCTTRIRMGGPRSVVAVFDPVQDEACPEPDPDLIVGFPAGMSGGGGGGNGLGPSVGNFWAGGPICTGGGRTRNTCVVVWQAPSTPVPEPTTLCLMGLGTAMAARMALSRRRPQIAQGKGRTHIRDRRGWDSNPR